MLKCVSLSIRDLKEFYQLNKRRSEFNNLNEDFFEIYNNQGPLKQFFLRKSVLLIKCHNNIMGYLWMTKADTYSYRINSMFVDSRLASTIDYSDLMNFAHIYKSVVYSCEKRGDNYEILNSLGFRRNTGTYEMFASLKYSSYFEISDELEFKILEKHCEEKIRCKIQNEVFKNDTRIPLTIEDMYFDEEQDYYFDKGAVLLKKDGDYIGYGQIIILDNTPTIVNIGILKEYRGRGYGKALMKYLLNILKDNSYSGVYLKVADTNLSALNIYKSLGFKILKEVHDFEYKKGLLSR